MSKPSYDADESELTDKMRHNHPFASTKVKTSSNKKAKKQKQELLNLHQKKISMESSVRSGVNQVKHQPPQNNIYRQLYVS